VDSKVEPWLRGTLSDVEPVLRAVLHALELTGEDASRWCSDLTDMQIFARPHALPSVAFQLRHISRSLDRLLTYAEGAQLNTTQLVALASEASETGAAADVLEEFRAGLQSAAQRVHATDPKSFAELRVVGRKMLPTTVAGLLVHCAEHTQRHTGQMVTTAKLVQHRESLR
jgi:uncharacterized damage-inducible protein DinB